jgi:hypothetical protein
MPLQLATSAIIHRWLESGELLIELFCQDHDSPP